MIIEEIQKICKSLPSVTEDIKWEHDLCFSIGGKMFVVIGLNESPITASFKVKDEEFEEISSREGFMPAPYLARYKWVHIIDINKLSKKDWLHYIQQSYNLIKSKLPKKILMQLAS
jgi:predicted DNA-binding protein (MmcQ/YjbR family)